MAPLADAAALEPTGTSKMLNGSGGPCGDGMISTW